MPILVQKPGSRGMHQTASHGHPCHTWGVAKNGSWVVAKGGVALNPRNPMYPLVMIHIAIENGPIEIMFVFPLKMLDLSMANCKLCKRLPEGTVIHQWSESWGEVWDGTGCPFRGMRQQWHASRRQKPCNHHGYPTARISQIPANVDIANWKIAIICHL